MLVQMFGRLKSVVGWISAVCALSTMAFHHNDASNDVIQNGDSCDVMGIRIRDRKPSTSKVTFELDLRDPEMCKKGSWKISSAGGGFSSLSIKGRQGSACFQAKGKFQLKVGSVTSDVFEVPSPSVSYSPAFLSFSTKTLALNLSTRGDNRAGGWRLTVYKCEVRGSTPKGRVESRYAEEECAVVPDVGCGNYSTQIRVDADFDLDACYVFHLDPIDKADTCPLLRDNEYFTHPHGCYPSAPATPQPPEVRSFGRLTALWFVLLAVGVMLAGVTCALIMVMLRGKLCGRLKNDGVANSGSTTKAKRHPMPAMVLYAADSFEHLARVSSLMQELKRQLDCQILDLHDDRNADLLADPAGYILQATSFRSFTRVILVLSSEVTRLQRSILENGLDTEAPSSKALSARGEPKDLLLLLALKRLHELDLVYNYSRIFVVSLDDTEAPSSEKDVKLLVDARRYQLPKHWSALLAALSATAPC